MPNALTVSPFKEKSRDYMEYHFDMVSRNVIDKYKTWTTEEIKADLDTKRLPFVVAFENLNGDLNAAAALRNLNAFAGESFIFIGRRRWNRRPSLGVQSYETILYSPDFSILEDYKARGYTIVAAEIDPNLNPVALHKYTWPEKVVCLFGEEGIGLSPEALSYVDRVIYVEQFGSIRSMNVATVSGLMMFHYSCQKRI